MNLDWINIKELEVFARVGVPDGERAQPQRLLLDIGLAWDFRKAGVTDNLVDTIDYWRVSRFILAQCGQGEWRLIEKMADDLTVGLFRNFNASKIRIRVKKFIIPESRWVSVQMTRAREDYPGRL